MVGMARVLTGVCDCLLRCPDALPVKVELHILMRECAGVAAVVALGIVLHIGTALEGPSVTAGLVFGGIDAMPQNQGHV